MIQNTMLYIRSMSGLKMITIVVILMLAGAGCKSKKKAMEASNAAAEKARIEQEAAAKKQREEHERARREAEARAQAERDAAAKKNEPYSRLERYFSSISGSGNTTAANNSINEALAMFASPETPVLIIISKSGDQKDYDRPTTIRDYLNYLKDQQKNANKIEKLEFDGAGKITTVELTKLK